MRVARDETNEEVYLNLTAFIDMMLVLVIFFLATSRFHEDERDERIRLAQTRSRLPIATASEVLVINIDKEGRRLVDGKQRTLEELEELLRARKGARSDLDVVVRADVRGLLAPFMETVEVCHRLGVKTPNITYESTEDR
ncbi:MAG: biopolymer transporter ExbD [Planctomycetes bacterium]|nr:biopolymer transporter ExbD [Planctomycetota bacterium]